MKHIQIEGKLIEFCDTDGFIERPLLPPDLPAGRVISPVKFIQMQRFVKSQYMDDRKGTKIEIRDIDELKYSTCIVFGDGEGFVAVSPRGEIVSLLKSPAGRLNNFEKTDRSVNSSLSGNMMKRQRRSC